MRAFSLSRAARGRRFFDECNFSVVLLIDAVCKSFPKTVLFTLIVTQSEPDTNALVGLTISLVLALVNALRAYNLYLTELCRELARVKPPSAGNGPPPRPFVTHRLCRLMPLATELVGMPP